MGLKAALEVLGVCRELAECKFAEYPIDTYGKATLGMAPLFSSQWASSQDSSQSQGMLGSALGADPRSPGFGGTQATQAAAGMVRATLGATVAQSASLALSVPREDLATLGFTQGSSTTRSDTLSDRAVVRRRFDRSAVPTSAACELGDFSCILTCAVQYDHTPACEF